MDVYNAVTGSLISIGEVKDGKCEIFDSITGVRKFIVTGINLTSSELPGPKGDKGDKGDKGEKGFDGVEIALAPCTSLGVMFDNTNDQVSLSWTDPEDIILNGAILARWARTVLVQKQGDIPQAWNDGTIVAETKHSDLTKNYYRDNSVIVPKNGYFYKLFSLTEEDVWNNNPLNLYATNTENLSWGQIRQIVQSGRGREMFPVGTVFVVDHAEYKHTDGSGLYFRVVAHDEVPAMDERVIHTMCLDMTETLGVGVFDEKEKEYALTADTVALANKKYLTYDSETYTYTQLVVTQDYNIGDPVPPNSWYEQNLQLSLGKRSAIGSNNYQESNLNQWANSSGNANEWYTPTTIFDQCSTDLLAKNGFLRYLDQEFVNAVIPAKLTNGHVDYLGYQTVTYYEKFWILDFVQLTHDTKALEYYRGNVEHRRKNIMDKTGKSLWTLRNMHENGGIGFWYDAIKQTNANATPNGQNGHSFACIIG